MNFFKRFLRAWHGAGREDAEPTKLLIQQLKIMSASLDNLTAATSRLATAVDAAVAAGASPAGVPEAAVQSAADAVSAQVSRLNAAFPAAPATTSPAS